MTPAGVAVPPEVSGHVSSAEMDAAAATSSGAAARGLPPGPRLPMPAQTLLGVFFTER